MGDDLWHPLESNNGTVCPSAYDCGEYEGTCFKCITETFSWSDAQSNCEYFGGNLASVGSSEENWYLARLGEEQHLSGFWIGLYEESGSWTWVDGRPFSYEIWQPGSPSANQPCAMLVNQWMDQWHSSNCGQQWPSICQLVNASLINTDLMVNASLINTDVMVNTSLINTDDTSISIEEIDGSLEKSGRLNDTVKTDLITMAVAVVIFVVVSLTILCLCCISRRKKPRKNQDNQVQYENIAIQTDDNDFI